MQDGTLPDTSSWYRDRYRIYNKDIDFREEFRFTSLLTMIQETAWNHAKVLDVDYSQEAFSSVFWVLSRMRIEMFERAPRWMEHMELATNPTGIDKLFARRDFLAFNAEGKAFARTTSSWVIIDSETRRLQRPQAYIGHRSALFVPSILPEPAGKLREAESYDWGADMTASYNDIDSHLHVNNVRYVEWCLERIAPEHYDRYTIASFDVNFLSELSWGDNFRVGVSWSAADMRHSFKILKNDGETSAALVELSWRSRETPYGA